jgi:glycosyltransferase involved in cell wall biosynthesis
VKPVLFVTNLVAPERVEPFRRLHAREDVRFALFGGRSTHAVGAAGAALPFPHERIAQRQAFDLAASGRFRAVVCGTAGRTALPAAYLGARRARVPFLLWSALWAHPRTPAGLAGWPLMRHVYRHANAIATYGPHVSAYVRRHGAGNVHEAPQAVDNEFWSAPIFPQRAASYTAVFTGEMRRAKGVRVLFQAWRASGLQASEAALVLVGDGPVRARAVASSAAHFAGFRPPDEVRNFYAAADVLIMPSIATAAFREPWGLVANEAMNQGIPVIATDAVGAAAGGLVRHERNGLVVPAGDAAALAKAIRRLHDDPDLRTRLGSSAREDVRAYTFDAWVAGMAGALASMAASKEA